MRAARVVPVVVAAAAFLALFVLRGYPWQLALLAGGAIGALVYVALRTVQNMRHLAATTGSSTMAPTYRTTASPADRENRSRPPPSAGASSPGDPSR
jgi:hypothetical protein